MVSFLKVPTFALWSHMCPMGSRMTRRVCAVTAWRWENADAFAVPAVLPQIIVDDPDSGRCGTPDA